MLLTVIDSCQRRSDRRDQLSHVGRLIAAFLLVLLPACVTAGPSPEKSASPPEQSAASGQDCRPVACSSWLIFETSEGAADQLVGVKRVYRIERNVGGVFGASEIRAHLERRLAPRVDSLFLVGAFAQFTGDERPEIQSTNSGDGLSCSVRRLGGKTSLTLELLAATGRTPLADGLVLSPADLLLIRLPIAGRSCIGVARAPFLDPANFNRDSEAVRGPLGASIQAEASRTRWLYLTPRPGGSVAER